VCISWTIKCFTPMLFMIIICKHYWDPKKIGNFLINWFIIKA